MAEIEEPNKANGHLPPQHPPQTNGDTDIESSQITHYLSALLTVTLGATAADLEADGSIFCRSGRNYDETIKRCQTFLTESQIAIYANKHARRTVDATETTNGHQDGGMSVICSPRINQLINLYSQTDYTPPRFVYSLSASLPIDSNCVGTVGDSTQSVGLIRPALRLERPRRW